MQTGIAGSLSGLAAATYLKRIPMSAASVAAISLNSKIPLRSEATAAPWTWEGAARLRTTHSLDAETSLVGRCLAGEQGAWEELITAYTKRVYGICYRFTGRDNEAQDLTQEVFLRVFRTLNSFRAGEGSFVVDRVTDAIEDKLATLEERTSHGSRTDGLLAGREAGELLRAALLKLSPELREAVILRDLQEMEYREIARVLNVPEGTVKSRLNRGRAELARVLKRNKVTV